MISTNAAEPLACSRLPLTAAWVWASVARAARDPGRLLCLSLLASASFYAFFLATARPASGQFYFTGPDSLVAAPGPGEGPFEAVPVSLAPTSIARYYTRGNHWRDRQAAQDNNLCIGGGGCSPRNGHTIRGTFSPGQLFSCGPFPGGLNPLACGGRAYYVKPRCPTRFPWVAGARVMTQRGYINWIPDFTSATGHTACWTPPPPPPACMEGAGVTDIVIFPLDGRVSPLGRPSREMPPVRYPAPLTRFESMGGESFFVNEYMIAEKGLDGSYSAVSYSGADHHVAEALQEVERSTPHRRLSPSRVLVVTMAQHGPEGRPTPPPSVRFPAVHLRSPAASRRPEAAHFDEPPLTPRPALPSEETWTFAALFDVRDALGLPRESRVLWSDRETSERWLDELAEGMTIDWEKLDHRLLVYVVVEVHGGMVNVAHQLATLPRCCCGEELCP